MAPKRKMGLTRMDAALDHMATYGFSKQLVRKKLKILLKLYGNEGWKLIEEDGYKVLLDIILDEQENLSKDASVQHENPGKELVTVESSEVAAKDASLEGSKNATLTSYTGVENREHCKDTALDRNTLHPYSEDPLLLGPSSDVARKRRPCYGWISDDDIDEETKLIAQSLAE